MRFTLVRRFKSLTDDIFRKSPSFNDGLTLGKNAVVALESTVICHGLPFPQNWETAKALEKIIVENGAKPATIAIMKGKVSIGLSEAELEELARADAKDCAKVSRRDLSYVVSKAHPTGPSIMYGGTTVSATMLLAHQAGISVFATGGIGGVHRDGQNSLDISADLTELGRTPVAVVCAGVKSILDIPRTLEYLETQGVCVATVGDTADFPSFFSRKSGCFSPCHVTDPVSAAALIYTQKRLNIQSGILLAVPIPQNDEIPNDQVEQWLQQALKDAEMQKILGRNITPFLLKRLNELSAGKTLKANVALLRNNAKVAAQIAVALKRIEEDGGLGVRATSGLVCQDTKKPSLDFKSNISLKRLHCQTARPVVIGGTVLDIMAKCQSDFEMDGSTQSGDMFTSCGGVGRNIAQCLARLDSKPLLLSAIGQDYNAEVIKKACGGHMDLSNLLELPQFSTSSYVGLLSKKGQLHAGIMNMEIHGQITPDYVSRHKMSIQSSPMVVLDGNLSVETIDYVLDLTAESKVPVWYDPTDMHKADKAFHTNKWDTLSYLSPNLKELVIIFGRLGINMPENMADWLSWASAERGTGSDHMKTIGSLFQLMPNLRLLLVKLGKMGSLVVSNNKYHCQKALTRPKNGVSADLSVGFYEAPNVPDEELVNVSGSGDCMVGGIIHGLLNKWDVQVAVQLGTKAASCSLRSHHTVPHIS